MPFRTRSSTMAWAGNKLSKPQLSYPKLRAKRSMRWQRTTTPLSARYSNPSASPNSSEVTLHHFPITPATRCRLTTKRSSIESRKNSLPSHPGRRTSTASLSRACCAVSQPYQNASTVLNSRSMRGSTVCVKMLLRTTKTSRTT